MGDYTLPLSQADVVREGNVSDPSYVFYVVTILILKDQDEIYILDLRKVWMFLDTDTVPNNVLHSLNSYIIFIS